MNYLRALTFMSLVILNMVSFGQDIDNSYIQKSTFSKVAKLEAKASKQFTNSTELEQEIQQKQQSGGNPDKISKLQEAKDQSLSRYYELHREITEFYKADYLKELVPFRNDSSSYEMHIIRAKLSYEDAKSMFQSSDNMLQDAIIPDQETSEKFNKLEQIKNTHTSALKKLKEALDFYNKKINTEPTTNYTPDNEKVKVNDDLLKNIQSKLQDLNPNDDIFYKYSELIQNQNFDGDKALNLWYAYLNRKIDEDGKTNVSTVVDSSFIANISDSSSSQPQMIFKVQIANNNEPLSQSILRTIYNGSHEIKQTLEDGQYKYLVGNFGQYNDAEQFKNQLNIPNAFVIAFEKEPVTIPIQGDTETYANNTNNTNTYNPNNSNQNQTNNPSNNVVNNYTGTSGIVFKVQIAANRSPISNDNLSNLYSGLLSIDQHYYDDWHKYSIGSFSEYKEAKSLKSQIKVSGAFVTAYKDNQLIELWRAIQETNGSPAHSTGVAPVHYSGSTYKIQLAAAKRPLTQNEIKKLCKDYSKVVEHQQNGWYLYSIGNFDNYKSAQEYKKTNAPEGSFITIYRNGQRTVPPLVNVSSLSFSNQLTIKSGVDYTVSPIFKVQIAASKNKLSSKYLESIYNGTEIITENLESPWYKYTIGAFNSINEAKNLKRSIDVSGAFIVAYKNGMRISITEALNQN